MKLDEIVWEKDIYPRQNKSQKTIDSYVEALGLGAIFPPVEVQRVSNYSSNGESPHDAILITDGVHRWSAYQEAKAETIEVIEWQPGISLDYPTQKFDLKLRGAEKNLEHGDRLKGDDKMALAREIAEADPGKRYTEEMIAKKLGVAQNTVGKWVEDIRASQTANRDSIIHRLVRLGWIQEEIADKTGIDRSRVSQIVNFSNIAKINNFFYEDKKPPHWIAEHFGLDLLTTWSYILDGQSDAKRFELFGLGSIQPYDVWTFQGVHQFLGGQHPGRIPGQLIAHVMYFFTQPNDIVIDPMVGGGTTLDVALVMGRRCYGYDIDHRHNRPDIIHHDMLQDGWPDRLKKADLIFWDPPYYRKKDDQYIEGSISKLPRPDYLNFFTKALEEAREVVNKKTKLAFLMSDWDDNTNKEDGIFIWDYADILRKSGWKLTRQIQCPLTTQQVHPDIILKFRESRRLARLERYLIMAVPQ